MLFRSVTNLAPADADVIADRTATQIEERWLVPKRYATPDSSKLTAEVVDGSSNDFTFELTD